MEGNVNICFLEFQSKEWKSLRKPQSIIHTTTFSLGHDNVSIVPAIVGSRIRVGARLDAEGMTERQGSAAWASFDSATCLQPSGRPVPERVSGVEAQVDVGDARRAVHDRRGHPRVTADRRPAHLGAGW